MHASQTITLEIPAETLKEIRKFRRQARIGDDETAAFELIKYALTLPVYFRDFSWEKAEKEADKNIKAGKVKRFASVNDLLADLKA